MPKTLLLADDSVVIQKLVGLSFANEDVELVTTDNGDDAVTKARQVKPDAVLADVVMPGMNGYDVCEAIKRDPELQGTPVLLLTGTFEAFDEARAAQVGSDGHITKPFEAQALVERVNQLFAASSAAAAVSAGANASPAPDASEDDGFDLFDDNTGDLAGEEDIALSTPAANDDFAFDDDEGPDALPAIGADDLLVGSVDLDPVLPEPGGDRTVVLGGEPFAAGGGAPARPEGPAAQTPGPIDDDVLAVGERGSASLGDADLTVLADMDLDAPTNPTHAQPIASTVIMSDGDNSSDLIDFGAAGDPLPARSRGDSADRAQPDGLANAITDPGETVLADDLFDDDRSPATASPAAAEDDVFDFDSVDPLAASADPLQAPPVHEAASMSSVVPPPVPPIDDSDPLLGIGPEESATPLAVAAPPSSAADYDVSISDLGDPFAPGTSPGNDAAAPAGPSAPIGPPPLEETESPDLDVVSVSDGLLGTPIQQTPPDEASEGTDLVVGAPGSGGPDISPVMRDRIHETLERVAWEAFADLSDTLVKQVLERVEAIAWEVIPQMAEALVKEEIRRMKGEDEG